MTEGGMVVRRGMATDEGWRGGRADGRGAVGHGYLEPVIYTGSGTRPCTVCGLELYGGPRQQVALAEVATSVLLCLWCAEQRAAAAEVVTVAHLDNPEGAERD